MNTDRNRDTVTGSTTSDKVIADPLDEGHRPRRVLSASTLAGDRVRNNAGEDLGKIEELMIDIPTGRIAYAVLSFGGFLGMGNKLFAVPWNAFTVDEREHELILNADKQMLESAPGFDKDNWPDMADPSWGSQVYSHYGQKPYWNAADTDTLDRRDYDTTSTSRSRTLKGGGGV